MSVHVYAITPADEKWHKMKAIYDACKNVDIEPPPEVDEFFNGEPPDDNGVVEEIDHLLHKENANGHDSFLLDIDDLPNDATALRIEVHY